MPIKLIALDVDGTLFGDDLTPSPRTQAALHAARAADRQCNVYIDDQIYVERLTSASDIYFHLNRRSPPQPVPDLLALVRDAPHDPTKLVLVLPTEAETDATIAAIEAHFGERVYATKSHPNFAEVINPQVNKGVALAAVAAHYGIAQAETMAVGDGMNDLPMLEWAGLGVAMGQAYPQVHAAADVVTASLAEDGLAQAIERYVLNKV
jgi:Cof subfamily protein (haloacid dehalogenase superfamily)